VKKSTDLLRSRTGRFTKVRRDIGALLGWSLLLLSGR
jgi:hypothetical protein